MEAYAVRLPRSLDGVVCLPQSRSAAMLVSITAFMPLMLVIVPMVIAIIVTLVWDDDTATCKDDQFQ